MTPIQQRVCDAIDHAKTRGVEVQVVAGCPDERGYHRIVATIDMKDESEARAEIQAFLDEVARGRTAQIFQPTVRSGQDAMARVVHRGRVRFSVVDEPGAWAYYADPPALAEPFP